MPYILATDEFTVPLYSSRSKTSPKRRQAKSSTTPTGNPSRSSTVKSSQSSTVRSSTRSTVKLSTRSTIKEESDIERESPVSFMSSSSTNHEVFPAPEPIRPVFCCTTVEPNERGQTHTLSSTSLILQRGRLRSFLDYISEYSLSNKVPVVEGLTSLGTAEYLAKVSQYRREDAPGANIRAPPQKRRKTVSTIGRKGKFNTVKKATHVKEWKQSAPGRYFVEVKHVKGQRQADDAFDEVLITDGIDGILSSFEMIEEITMEAECSVHSGLKWICEFWAKKE